MKTQTRTRTIPKTPFFAAFSVGAVLFSAHAGGGFATGNQANTYYVGLGWASCRPSWPCCCSRSRCVRP